jgi:hypothetical protein
MIVRESNQAERIVIYINVLPPLDPIKLVLRIMEKVESTGQSPFK